MSKRTPMMELKPIIKAMHEAVSYRQAQEQAKVSLGLMSKIKKGADSLNLTLGQFMLLPDEEIDLAVYGKPEEKKIVPDWQKVAEQLSLHKKMTLKAVYRKYVKDNGGTDKCYSYGRFCTLYKAWKHGLPEEVQNNLHFWGGERLEIDTSGDKIVWKDLNGVEHRSVVYVATLTKSGYTFVMVLPNEKTESWLKAIVATYNFLGGAPKKLVTDNAKALVRKVSKKGSEIQQALKALCDHYGVIVQPCPPRAPKCKNRVEFTVYLVQKDIIAAKLLEGGWVARDLDDLNVKLQPAIMELNMEILQGWESSRYDRFIEEDKPFLTPLPETPFEIGQWHYGKVDKGHCVVVREDNHHRYSVAPEYVGWPVVVHVTDSKIRIYSRKTSQLLAEHDRRRNEYGEKTHILPEHMTDKEKRLSMSKAQYIEKINEKINREEIVRQFVDKAWVDARTGRRICKGVLRVCKEFKPVAIEKAMQVCVEIGETTTDRLRKLAKEFEVEVTKPAADQAPRDYHTPEHENIRGHYE